jgi:hypothetical protein
MEKYNLNEGNESLKRVLLMMGYDSKKTLEENTKIIFEQEEAGDLINKYGKKMGVTLPSDLATPATGAPATGVPATGAPATGAPATAAPATPEVSLSYEDTVKKLQNLLITKYQAKLGESGPNKNGVDGKIGRLTLTALNNAIKTKVSQPVNEPSGEVKVDDKKTEIITPDNQLKPDNSVTVNPGSIDDWA